MLQLLPQPLTPAAFAPFGRVLQAPADGLGGHPINDGTATRFELVPDADLVQAGGRAVISLSRAQVRPWPMQLHGLERYRLGSQSFVPLGCALRFVLVVAPAGPAPQPQDLHAFITDGAQGVWLAPGTWHHGLLAVDAGDYLVIERRAALGDGAVDCDVCTLQPSPTVVLPG
jgi:ureidoglycolate lyase